VTVKLLGVLGLLSPQELELLLDPPSSEELPPLDEFPPDELPPLLEEPPGVGEGFIPVGIGVGVDPLLMLQGELMVFTQPITILPAAASLVLEVVEVAKAILGKTPRSKDVLTIIKINNFFIN
jgi:hypothetical protein